MSSQQRVYLIGCQRSGTTLLRLILECHRDVFCYDELHGYRALAENQIQAPASANRIILKIPRWTEQLLDPILWDEGLPFEAARFYDGERIIFVTRDPKGSVGSMVKLSAGVKSWLETYPPPIIRAKLDRDARFRDLYAGEVARAECSAHPAVSFGALYWKYKNAAFFRYLAAGLPVALLRYESLVINPEAVLRGLCDFLEIEWDNRLLRHEEFEHRELFSSGMTLGETDPSQPIHAWSIDAWQSLLSVSEAAEIDRTTEQERGKFAALWQLSSCL